MTKFRKLAFLALVPLFAFFSCKNESELYDYVQESKSPEISVVGNSVSGGSDSYVLDLTNSLPGQADGEFTIYVKNAKPSNILIKSTSSKVKFTKGNIEETTASDSVGTGSYKMKVSYSVAQDLELQENETALSFDFTIFAQFTSEDAVSKKVNFSVNYVEANPSLALTNFVVSNQNEHVFTLSWENPTGIDFKSMDYVIYLLTTTGEGESATTIKTKVESGNLEANANSFTTKTNLASKSNYYVEITTVSANAWYVSNTEGTQIATTDDITPPNKPNITFVSSTEDSITLKYTKGDSSDDTATLYFSIASLDSENNETALTSPTISATLGSGETSSTITYSDDKGLDVSSLEANAELEILISSLTRSKTETSYKITSHAKDALGNDSAQTSGTVVNEEDNRNTVITAKTEADTVAPSLSTVSVSNGTSSAKISWTEPSDSDFAGVKIKNGDTQVADVKKGTSSYTLTDLTQNATYTLFAYDTVGNEQETGLEAKVELESLTASASQKYTGSILVTWNNITDYDSNGEAITYTYSVSGTGPTTITSKTSLTSGTTGAHFTGLTVSDDKTTENLYTFTVNATASSTTKTASTQATAAKTVIWTIVNAYQNSAKTSYNVIPYIPKTANSYPSDDVVSRTDPANYKFTKWIVEPGLSDSSDSDLFSLVATTSDNTNAGLYMFFDFDNESRYSDKNGYEYPSWYSSGEKTHAFVTALGDDKTKLKDGGELSYATFKLGKSANTTSPYVNGTASTTGWNRFVSAYNSDYALYDYGNRESAHTSSDTSSGVEASFTYAQELLDTACENLAPSAPTTLTATAESASSVKLTWTNPTDADFSHVVITCDSNDSISEKSTGTSATITGLTGGTNYTFKITAYDYYGNASSSVSFAQVSTPQGTDKPTDAKVTVGYTGQLIVTWTDATNSSDYTYTVSATSSGDDTVSPQTDIAQGTQKAVFNGLTVGNTYTFTVKATVDSTDYTSDTVSAQAVKVLWSLVGGYGNRVMVCNILKNDENSCTTDYNVIAEDSSQSSGTSGNCNVVSFSTLSYPYWLVMPSLNLPNDTDHFSLMASDSSGTESGYYLYSDSLRNVSSSSNLAHWWTSLDTVNGWSPKLFVAKTSESYITDNSMASFTQESSSYTDSSKTTWVNFKCDYNNYYVQHSNLIYRLLSSITEEDCAALAITQTTLTE